MSKLRNSSSSQPSIVQTSVSYDATCAGATRLARPPPPATPAPAAAQYASYPGLYFPPTDSSEARNPLKNYDFIIGACY